MMDHDIIIVWCELLDLLPHDLYIVGNRSHQDCWNSWSCANGLFDFVKCHSYSIERRSLIWIRIASPSFLHLVSRLFFQNYSLQQWNLSRLRPSYHLSIFFSLVSNLIPWNCSFLWLVLALASKFIDCVRIIHFIALLVRCCYPLLALSNYFSQACLSTIFKDDLKLFLWLL